MRPLAPLLALALVVPAACGGGDDARPAAAHSDATTSSTSTAAEAPAADAGDGGAGSTGGDTSTVGPDAPTTTTAASGGAQPGGGNATPEPNVELHRECVVRGSATDLQGFTADVPAGTIVIYSTEYSDRSNEVTNPEYTTGFGDTKAVGDGGASATWVVPAQAPTGRAVLHVAGTVELRPRELPFEVVDDREDCP